MDRRAFIAFGATSSFLTIMAPEVRAVPARLSAAPQTTTFHDFEKRMLKRFANARIREDYQVALDASFLLGGEALISWSQELDLSGLIATRGGSLAIITRRLKVAANTIIDTSGPVGQPDHGEHERAQDGRSPGEAGANGAVGGNGTDGGDLLIVCRDIVGDGFQVRLGGGPGGRGQSGGNGQDGAKGADGQSGARCTAGETGQTGGNAGAGGAGGTGGAGGWLFVQAQNVLKPEMLAVMNLAGGGGGFAGVHGLPGSGGAGGNGSFWETPDRGGSRF